MVFRIGAFYHFFSRRCGRKTASSSYQCFGRPSLRTRLLFPSVVGFHPCGCGKPFPSGRLTLAVAEGRALCASAVAVAESVSFSDPLMFPLLILNSFCGAVYPLFFRCCGYGSAFVLMLDTRLFVTRLSPPLRMDLWFGLSPLQKEVCFRLPIQISPTSDL